MDAQFMSDRAKFFAGTLSALSAMVRLEVPHVNVLSKMDLMGRQKKSRDMERYAGVRVLAVSQGDNIILSRYITIAISWEFQHPANARVRHCPTRAHAPLRMQQPNAEIVHLVSTAFCSLDTAYTVCPCPSLSSFVFLFHAHRAANMPKSSPSCTCVEGAMPIIASHTPC